MSISESILPEFDHEMENTRAVLERIPEDKLSWKAHPKSNTMGWVGAHLAEVVGWGDLTLQRDSFDVQPVGGEPYRTPMATSRQQILDTFDKNLVAVRQSIVETSDAKFGENWSLMAAGNPIFTMSRLAVIRNFVLNHIIHHRAILCVYLRLNDVPVPGLYGPSGDEPQD